MRVVDTRPPVIVVSVSPAVLWPPNHALVPIVATVSVSDAADPLPIVRLISITSNEPDNRTGDGDTTGDIAGADVGTPDLSFALRAERAAGGTGRVYTITYQATDASGNATRVSVSVIVPLSRTKK